MFYAIQWTYGRACGSDGERIGRYFAFSRKLDRATWIEGRKTEFSSQAGFREEIAAKDPELRREIAAGSDGRVEYWDAHAEDRAYSEAQDVEDVEYLSKQPKD